MVCQAPNSGAYLGRVPRKDSATSRKVPSSLMLDRVVSRKVVELFDAWQHCAELFVPRKVPRHRVGLRSLGLFDARQHYNEEGIEASSWASKPRPL
uniref:Uncharacterized protein n=1 Tax=Nelumbo nucifera TaxID=4432 RepID=A0A822XCJ1_NELNU|nr:TPA_asm: hypothetical protein HUJ06_019350 [Nelumbo nucifera]